MTDLIRLTITVPGDDAELLSAALAVNVPYGWEEDTLPTGEAVAFIHAENQAFLAELEQALKLLLPSVSLRRDQVPNKDWTLAWREFFTPVEAGSRFLVLAPWMAEEIASPRGRTPIIIEPKTAFGTGHHATTALCLEALSGLAEAGTIRPGMAFLDLGTGSGILSIACVSLGLRGIGLDIDMLAVENALENAALNKVSANAANAPLRIARGSIDDAEGSFDLIVANILAQPLRDMAPAICSRLAAGGVLVLSGILDVQAESVMAVYREQGLPQPEKVLRGEWAALVWS